MNILGKGELDLGLKNLKMTETLFWRVANDFLTIGIVGGFALLVYSKFKKISMREALEEIKELFIIGGKEE